MSKENKNQKYLAAFLIVALVVAACYFIFAKPSPTPWSGGAQASVSCRIHYADGTVEEYKPPTSWFPFTKPQPLKVLVGGKQISAIEYKVEVIVTHTGRTVQSSYITGKLSIVDEISGVNPPYPGTDIGINDYEWTKKHNYGAGQSMFTWSYTLKAEDIEAWDGGRYTTNTIKAFVPPNQPNHPEAGITIQLTFTDGTSETINNKDKGSNVVTIDTKVESDYGPIVLTVTVTGEPQYA